MSDELIILAEDQESTRYGESLFEFVQRIEPDPDSTLHDTVMADWLREEE